MFVTKTISVLLAAAATLLPAVPASATLIGDSIVIKRIQGVDTVFKTVAATVGDSPEYIDNFFAIDITENEVRFDTFGNLSLGQIVYTIDGLDFDDNPATPNIVTEFFSKQIFRQATGFPPIDSSNVTISPSGQLRVSFANTVTGADGFASVTLGAPSPAAVPEPATWAMMIGGFGLAGSAARRRTTRAARVLA
ncbi:MULTISPECIES: PEPxxWA-CTERM sorting domain-containing protein [Sphingomonas]|uniref:PEPxxWA-CTERM sorting domain-containing protein n=1 Tax=Sphingomonas TaxID=13687 RepID=UPI001E34B377|nr:MULTISPECIES: PEPxxWA-CTERM sorting domain-containing protein [Sphingomonas]